MFDDMFSHLGRIPEREKTVNM